MSLNESSLRTTLWMIYYKAKWIWPTCLWPFAEASVMTFQRPQISQKHGEIYERNSEVLGAQWDSAIRFPQRGNNVPKNHCAAATKTELTNILARVELDCKVYQLHQWCSIMTNNGWEELHLRDHTRYDGEKINYSERHDDDYKLVGHIGLRLRYCSHMRRSFDSMDFLNQYLMWTSLCTTKCRIRKVWTTNLTPPNPHLDRTKSTYQPRASSRRRITTHAELQVRNSGWARGTFDSWLASWLVIFC